MMIPKIMPLVTGVNSLAVHGLPAGIVQCLEYVSLDVSRGSYYHMWFKTVPK